MLAIEKEQIKKIADSLVENEEEAKKKYEEYKKAKTEKTRIEFEKILLENKKAVKKNIPLLQEIFRFSDRKINTIFDNKLYMIPHNSYYIYPSTFFEKVAFYENLKTNDWWEIK